MVSGQQARGDGIEERTGSLLVPEAAGRIPVVGRGWQEVSSLSNRRLGAEPVEVHGMDPGIARGQCGRRDVGQRAVVAQEEDACSFSGQAPCGLEGQHGLARAGSSCDSEPLAFHDQHPVLPVQDEEVDLPFPRPLALVIPQAVVHEEPVVEPVGEGIEQGPLGPLSRAESRRRVGDHVGHVHPPENSCGYRTSSDRYGVVVSRCGGGRQGCVAH
jgi:hypothetical protein